TSTRLAASVGTTDGAARWRGGAEDDRGGPRSGRVPTAEAGVPVHRRDGAAVAARTEIAPARAATCGVRRGSVTRRMVVARPGACLGPVAAHVAWVAEEGLDARPPGRG